MQKKSILIVIRNSLKEAETKIVDGLTNFSWALDYQRKCLKGIKEEFIMTLLMCINGGNAIYHCRSLLDLFELLAVQGVHIDIALTLCCSVDKNGLPKNLDSIFFKFVGQ